MFTLFGLAALLVGFLRYVPVASLPSSLQPACYLKPSPQANNNYSTYFTYPVPATGGTGIVFLWPEQGTISPEVMNSSISQLQGQISSTLLTQNVPNGRFNSTTPQNVDYYLEQGFRGELQYQHVAWSLDALRDLYYQNIYQNVIITVSDSASSGLCAVGAFQFVGDGTATTDSSSSSPTFTPKFISFNYPDPSNAYNSPIPSPTAASDYPPGFGIPPLPSSNNGGDASGQVVNESADDTTAQIA